MKLIIYNIKFTKPHFYLKWSISNMYYTTLNDLYHISYML